VVDPGSEGARAVALNVAVCYFVLVIHTMIVVPIECFLTRIPTGNPMYARVADILDPSFSSFVDLRGHIGEAKMLGEKIVIIGVTVCIDVGLHSCDNVSILRRGNRTEEDACAVSGGEVYLAFCLEAEVELISAAKFKNVHVS
jgi:hypothetical protein